MLIKYWLLIDDDGLKIFEEVKEKWSKSVRNCRFGRWKRYFILFEGN